jgi:hypothetical protein
MPQRDVFVSKNSHFNAFLFADVGTEQNGSPLTILSILARLGMDPWSQAEKWARMPDNVKIESLTQSIVQMPLCPHDLAEAGVTAGRLIMLLPHLVGTTGGTEDLKIPNWVPIAIFCVVLGIAVVSATFVVTPTTPAPVSQMVERMQ